MKRILSILIFISFQLTSIAQIEVKDSFVKASKVKTDFYDYDAQIIRHSIPKYAHDSLIRKIKADKTRQKLEYLKNNSILIPKKSDLESAWQSEKLFAANPAENFTPMDNEIAVSKDGIVVSVVNANLTVHDSTGVRLLYRTFRTLAGNPGLNGLFFDPRVRYDEENDRFVMVILHGNNFLASRIIVYVSMTNNPLLGWHVYEIPAFAIGNQGWVDFPQLGLSKSDIFITGNIFNDNGQYRNSFIVQAQKQAAYQGSQLNYRVFANITDERGRNIFNPVPAFEAGGIANSEGMHFVSTFSSGGNEIQWSKIEGSYNSGSVFSSRIISTNAYSLSGDAIQRNHNELLDAGDTRVSSAFRKNGIIHFVHHSSDGLGFNTIRYHRLDMASAIDQSYDINGNATLDYAFASLMPAGQYEADKKVLINFLSSGASQYPGFNAVLIDDAGKIYTPRLMREANTFINVLAGTDRWGDYSGSAIMPIPNSNPRIFISAAIPESQTRWSNIIAILSVQDTQIYNVVDDNKINLYPNPVIDWFDMEINLKESQNIKIELFDAQGKRIFLLFEGVLAKGNNRLKFNKENLSSGIYFVRVLGNGKRAIKTEKIWVP